MAWWQNGVVHPGRDDLSQAELLSILSRASDLGVGLPAEHGLRACYIGLRIADQIGLTRGERADPGWERLDATEGAWE